MTERHECLVSAADEMKRPITVTITGPKSSGKTTLMQAIGSALESLGIPAVGIETEDGYVFARLDSFERPAELDDAWPVKIFTVCEYPKPRFMEPDREAEKILPGSLMRLKKPHRGYHPDVLFVCRSIDAKQLVASSHFNEPKRGPDLIWNTDGDWFDVVGHSVAR